MKKSFALGCLVLGVPAATPAPFINLDFELADTSGAQIKIVDLPNPFLREPLLFGTGLVSELLPGWTVYLGGAPEYTTDTMAMDNGFFETADPNNVATHASLLTTGKLLRALQIFNVNMQIEGQYALMLDNSRNDPVGGTRAIRVGQVGDIPSEARFLTFRTFGWITALIKRSPFLDEFTWQNPHDLLLFDAADPSRRFLDITPWAGQTVELSFVISGDTPAGVDSIAFVVPEPGTVTLFSLGAACLALVMRRRKR